METHSVCLALCCQATTGPQTGTLSRVPQPLVPLTLSRVPVAPTMWLFWSPGPLL